MGLAAAIGTDWREGVGRRGANTVPLKTMFPLDLSGPLGMKSSE